MWNKKYIQDSSEQLNLVVGFLKGMGRFVQGVLDYRDLNYREFAMPGLIKYSIYLIGSNTMCEFYFPKWLFGAHSIQILAKFAYSIQEICPKTGLLARKCAFNCKYSKVRSQFKCHIVLERIRYIIHNQPLEGLKSSSDMIFYAYKIWQNSLFSPFGGSCKKTNNIMA